MEQDINKNGKSDETGTSNVPNHSQQHTKPPLMKTLPFWATIISIVTVRQLFESTNRIFRNRWPQGFENLTGAPKFLASNAYSLLFGTLVASISTLYAKRSLEAIKTLYSDAVGTELGKNPEDVSYGDLLFRTKNTVVRNSFKGLKKENILRSLVISAFFLPWHLLGKTPEKLHNIQANIGSGFLGAYLFTNRYGNNASVLEALQTMVDTKLHHNSEKPYDIITSDDIGNLLIRHEKTLNKSYKPPALGTTAGENEILLTQRIADLLNNTYYNTAGGHSHFTLGKLIYLMGNNAGNTGKSFLNQDFPASMAYIELANKYDIRKVENVANAINNGTPAREAFANNGIKYDPTENTNADTDKQGNFSKKIPSMKSTGYSNMETKQESYAR